MLDDTIARVRGGTLALVLLEGEGGVGKSRLVEEALERSGARGLRVYKGQAEELERHRPFGPLTDAFGCDRSSSVPECSLIAHLLYPKDEQTGPLPSAGGPVLQFRVVEVLVELVQRLAAAGPLMLALEDVHWADSSTLLTIRSLTKRLSHLPVFILVSFRPTPPREELEALVQTSVEGGAVHLKLEPLLEDGVAEMATQLLRAAPGPRLRHLLSGAGGNPLFVTELLKTLDQEQALELADGMAETRHNVLPPTLRLTILRRLTSVSRSSIEILRLASVIGARFSLLDLAAVSGRSALELLPTVQDAVRAGLLVEAGPDLAFRHELVREAIYQDLPASLCAGLHREFARVLARADGSVDRVATHMALGARRGDREAIEWLLRAAWESAPRAPAESGQFLERAIDLLEASDPRRDALLSELVSLRLWTGRVAEGMTIAREVLARPHDPAVEGRVRLALARALMMLGKPGEAADVCRTDGRHESLQDWERVQLQADESLARMMLGDLEGAESTAAAAVADEPAGSDHATVAVSALSKVAMLRGDVEKAVGLARQVVDRVARSNDRALRHYASHYFLALCLISADRLEEAGRVIDEGQRAVEERGNLWTLAQLHLVSALRRLLLGEWDDAVADAETSLDMAGDVGTRQAAGHAYAILALIALHRGDVHEAERRVNEAAREPVLSWFVGWRGWVEGLLNEACGDIIGGLAALEGAWEHCREKSLTYAYPLIGPDLARLALQTGAVDRARSVAADMETAAARMSIAYARCAALRCRGLIANDVDLLLAAADAAYASQRVLARALADEDAGTALVGAGRRDEGVVRLEAALSIYEGLRAGLDIARVSASLRSLGVRRGARGPRRRPSTGWESLTPTELAVAKLVGEGLTNREIGERLFISPRTVETHVSHMFTKLGFSSRAELIAQAARRTALAPDLRS